MVARHPQLPAVVRIVVSVHLCVFFRFHRAVVSVNTGDVGFRYRVRRIMRNECADDSMKERKGGEQQPEGDGAQHLRGRVHAKKLSASLVREIPQAITINTTVGK